MPDEKRSYFNKMTDYPSGLPKIFSVLFHQKKWNSIFSSKTQIWAIFYEITERYRNVFFLQTKNLQQIIRIVEIVEGEAIFGGSSIFSRFQHKVKID